MAYDRVNWQDGASGGTPMSAENLNKMDSQIEINASNIDSNISEIENIKRDYATSQTVNSLRSEITQIKATYSTTEYVNGKVQELNGLISDIDDKIGVIGSALDLINGTEV